MGSASLACQWSAVTRCNPVAVVFGGEGSL